MNRCPLSQVQRLLLAHDNGHCTVPRQGTWMTCLRLTFTWHWPDSGTVQGKKIFKAFLVDEQSSYLAFLRGRDASTQVTPR